ncbi:MAG: DsbA family protein [Thiolinea sp.]
MNKRERQQLNREKKQAAADRNKKLIRYGIFALLGLLAIMMLMNLTRNIGLEVPELTEITANDHVKGYEKAPLTLVEYSDFQCPACRAQHNAIDAAWKDIRRHVKIVYRHYPLVRIHKNATLAAHYAEAAGRQDKFWEMHDALFAAQSAWSNLPDPASTFDGYAERLKLDMTRLKSDLESEELKDKVKADVVSGQNAGVRSTPTLFLDGELLSNVRDRQSLIDAIKNAKDLK